jgi:ribulose-phosphate 3-epimerase
MAKTVAKGRVLVAASVLDSDLADLSKECRRALKAGADRIHLDVMDGHFVPNITFGPGIIKKLRRIGRQPFDAHLMNSST